MTVVTSAMLGESSGCGASASGVTPGWLVQMWRGASGRISCMDGVGKEGTY